MVAGRGRREEYSEATRRALIDSATRLFAERGYTRTSLDDVVAAARVTKGALYHHFDGKQSLFEAVLDRLERTVHERILATAASAADPWHGVLAALDVFLDATCEPGYGRIVMQEGPVALGWSRWRECEDKYSYSLTEGMVRTLMEAGLIDPLPLEAATRAAFGLLSAAALTIAEADDATKQQRRAELGTVIRRMLTGLRPAGTAAP